MLKYLFAAIALIATPALAQDDRANQILPVGQFTWQDDPSITGDVHVMVVISTQMAYVYRGDTIIAMSNVSTGRVGHPTPVGVFHIMQKAVDHTSNIYHARMPFMERLTNDGVALHAGSVRAESHGCVHLPTAFAQLLFAATQTGDVVEIVEQTTSPVDDVMASMPD